MSDFAAMRAEILGDRDRPETKAECERIRDSATEIVRVLRSAISECVSVEHSLTRELTWTPPEQRQRLNAELDVVWADKAQVAEHIAAVEKFKSQAREVQYLLAKESADGKPRERQRIPDPAGRPRRANGLKRSFKSPGDHTATTVAHQAATVPEIRAPEYVSPSLSKVERLIRLSDLYANGAMTSAEFANARERIAGEEKRWTP